MSVIRRKTRTISIRLSDDEYGSLKNVCESQGVRSLSDFARLAIENLIVGGGLQAQITVQSRLDALNSRVEVLDLAVERLAGIFDVNGRNTGTAYSADLGTEDAVPACRP
jgi:hypothetical protein